MIEEIRLDELKTNLWHKAVKEHTKPELEYDQNIDTLSFYFVDTDDKAVITHYLDQNVSLLFRLPDNEIVGFSIEGFEKSFAAKYTGEKSWKLSSVGVEIKGIKEIKPV